MQAAVRNAISSGASNATSTPKSSPAQRNSDGLGNTDGATGMSVVERPRRPPCEHPARPPWPLRKCEMKTHRDPELLEPKKAPDGWFPDVRSIQP